MPHGPRIATVLGILIPGSPSARARASAVLAAATLLVLTAAAPRAGAAPLTAKGPVGWDTLRRLDLLPLHHAGVQTRQFSSYDRTGGNNDGIRGTYSCLRQTAAEGCVIAEHTGPGEVESIWFTRDRGVVTRTGRLRIEVDGRTVVNAPLQSVVNGGLGAPFSFPLVANAAQSSGGVYIKVPIPFRTSMKISTQANPLYYHVTYRAFPDAEGVPSFDPSDRAGDVLARLRASGLRDPKPAAAGATTLRRSFALAPGRRIVVGTVSGPGAITALRLRFPRLGASPGGTALARARLLRSARLQVSFDGQRTVDSPLGEFFGSGVAPATVRSLLLAQSPLASGSLLAWWPMPFRRSAVISVVNASSTRVLSAEAAVTHAPSPELVAALGSGQAGYFHATSHRGFTTAGRDWSILSVRGHGTLVGVSQTMRGPVTQRYLEGDERAFVDGPLALHGTGTEDFFEGGYYFNHGTFTRPLTGNPSHRVGGPLCPGSDCTGAYRLLIDDSVAFGSSLRFGMEHGNRNAIRGLYGSTAYWYG